MVAARVVAVVVRGTTTGAKFGMMGLTYEGSGRRREALVVEWWMKESCELALRLASLCLSGTIVS